MSSLLNYFNPVAVGQAFCLSAFGWTLIDGISFVYVGTFIVGTVMISFGVRYMRFRVANEVRKQIEPLGAEVIRVAYLSDNKYLLVACRADKTQFYLTVDKHGGYYPFDSDAIAVDNLKRTGSF